MNKGGRPPIALKVHHSVAELKDHFRACPCAVERRRTQVVWWLRRSQPKGGYSAFGLLSSSLVALIKRYNEHGLAGLRDNCHETPGAPSLLSDEELLLLAQVVRKDFDQGIVWDGAKVVRWLREGVGKDLHISRAYEALASIGFRPQLPRPAHSKADVAEQERFKKNAPRSC